MSILKEFTDVAIAVVEAGALIAGPAYLYLKYNHSSDEFAFPIDEAGEPKKDKNRYSTNRYRFEAIAHCVDDAKSTFVLSSRIKRNASGLWDLIEDTPRESSNGSHAIFENSTHLVNINRSREEALQWLQEQENEYKKRAAGKKKYTYEGESFLGEWPVRNHFSIAPNLEGPFPANELSIV
jgi:hypothetical protein